MIRGDELRLIANHYGLEHQLCKTVEELGELQIAISKRLLADTGTDIYKADDNIMEEFADVRVMLNQILYLIDGVEKSERYYHEKIDRQIDRLREEEEKNNDII